MDSPFHGKGYRKLWARLRFKDIRTSRRRVLRLMRAHGLLAPQRAGQPRGPKAHDGTITTERFIRTLKENLLWVCHFATVEELRLALIAFSGPTTRAGSSERHGYKAPAQVRAEQISPMPMAA